MFSNCGKTLKTLAVIVMCLGVIVSAITGFIYIAAGAAYLLSGILIIGIGVLSSWVSAITMYALGETTEKTDILLEIISAKTNYDPQDREFKTDRSMLDFLAEFNYAKNSPHSTPATAHADMLESSVVCKKCGAFMQKGQLTCHVCGEKNS